MRVPDEVAVVSLDGTEAGQYTLPTLTAVVQDVSNLAAEAVKILVSHSSDPATGPVHHILQPSLRRLDSCGCGSSLA